MMTGTLTLTGTGQTMSVDADLAAIRAIAEAVPDPELVVVTVGDLGIVRDIRTGDGTVEIDVTPTYSACPATLAIELEIETAVNSAGYAAAVRRVLSPAWTTDWLSEKGRLRLEKYGIAPPQIAGGPSRCPRCRSCKVEKISQFGSTPCKAQWRCQECLEPFDYFKCI